MEKLDLEDLSACGYGDIDYSIEHLTVDLKT